MENLNKIVEKAVKSAWPGLVPEYNFKTCFLCDTKFQGFVPAMARVSIHVVNEEGMAVHPLGEEQVRRIVTTMEQELGTETNHVTRKGNSVFLYWLDDAAITLGKLLTEDNPHTFGSILKRRDQLIGKTIRTDIPYSYCVWINSESRRKNVPCVIREIEGKDSDGRIRLSLRPIGENVEIEDCYFGDKYDSVTISGYSFEVLDYVLND